MSSVIFSKDLAFDDDPQNPVFKKGVEYSVLSSDKHFIYVNSKPGTKEVSQIPKKEQGHLFIYN